MNVKFFICCLTLIARAFLQFLIVLFALPIIKKLYLSVPGQYIVSAISKPPCCGPFHVLCMQKYGTILLLDGMHPGPLDTKEHFDSNWHEIL